MINLIIRQFDNETMRAELKKDLNIWDKVRADECERVIPGVKIWQFGYMGFNLAASSQYRLQNGFYLWHRMPFGTSGAAGHQKKIKKEKIFGYLYFFFLILNIQM